MKRSCFLLLILFPCLLLAQHKGHISGVFYFTKNMTISMNQEMVAFINANLKNIESIDGETIINIPIKRDYKKDRKTMLIDGYLVQYEWTIFPKETDVTVDNIRTTYLEFNLTAKTMSDPRISANDTGMFDTPTNLKDRIKAKDQPGWLKIK